MGEKEVPQGSILASLLFVFSQSIPQDKDAKEHMLQNLPPDTANEQELPPDFIRQTPYIYQEVPGEAVVYVGKLTDNVSSGDIPTLLTAAPHRTDTAVD